MEEGYNELIWTTLSCIGFTEHLTLEAKVCQFKSWNNWLDQHWKRQKMSDTPFLKFWVFENCSTDSTTSIFIYIFHVIHGFSNLSNLSVGIVLMKKLMLEAYNFQHKQVQTWYKIAVIFGAAAKAHS